MVKLAREAVRFTLGLAILLALLVAGNFISEGLNIPVPGSVVGMLLLVACLRLRIVRLPHVRPAAGVLIRYMGLLFVPPGVGLMLHFDLIRREWAAIVIAGVVSTLLVLFTVGFVMEKLDAHG